MTDPSGVEGDDDLFPSGPWVGYFIQRRSRFPMELDLFFRDGLVSGVGDDFVGPFSIRGRYDREELEVWWIKVYPTHDVYYRGFREGRGIWGTWEIRDQDRGGFKIWPKGLGAEEGEALAEEAPVEETVRVGG